MKPDQKEFFSIKEFAAKLGVHWFTVWRWTVENRITFLQFKAGGKILIPVSELSRFHNSGISP
jgi:excisionase family DNA binding protein